MSFFATNYYFGEPGFNEKFDAVGVFPVIVDANDGDDHVLGSFSGDLVRGGLGSDLIQGNGGDDVLFGDGSADADKGPGGVDMLFGSLGADAIYAGAGDDFASGDEEDDLVDGDGGDDLIWGGDGEDVLRGGKGDDELWGATPATLPPAVFPNLPFPFSIHINANGTAAVSVPVPSALVDSLFAFSSYGKLTPNDPSADQLSGGRGGDELHGGLGPDLLSGGGGKDKFFFDTALGPTNVDEIADFKPDRDKLALSKAIFTNLKLGKLDDSRFDYSDQVSDSRSRIEYNRENGNLYYDPDGRGGSKKILFATLDDSPRLTADDFVIVA